ncbi:phosphotransferase [Noviherbaspirillum saxi]|uniref:Phosphotransferase family protein n=1 Tax=Noviherbaspirillum saxi TaxID=2320863 RepID=A0A3A3FPP8_9BURK|nr:phosphotransferase [Noviherbaspirillum saxi]RJF95432.1 phosphotransferase family protein [Noviherbaspirillum saxi]
MNNDHNLMSAFGGQELDTGRLASYMREHVAGFKGTLETQRFKGGQSNPTYLLSAGDQRYVLRKKPAGNLLPSAHAVEREYRVITALSATDVPVARTYCLCEDMDVIGTPFYLMEYVEGRILWDPALPGMTPAERAGIHDDVNRVVAALHTVDHQAVGLGDFGKPGNYFERQIARWTKQYRASETEPLESMERLIEWLPAHIPASNETTIVHGDLRLDNMIFHPSEPRVLAILDWELSTLGHPLADVAYHVLPWRLRSDEFRGMAEHDIASLGVPSEAEYVRRYCERTGRAPVPEHEWNFYLAYSMFRLAAILQGILRRAMDGTASSAEAMEIGSRGRRIAELGWKQTQGTHY